MGSAADLQESDLRILIVGGGIAGLATAIALRAPGRHITVLERSRMLHETGALISLQPNATKIITQWGLDPILQRVASPQADRAFRMFDTEGHLVREMPLDTSAFGADRMLYHRQDLHSALQEAATSEGGGVEIRTAAEVVDCNANVGTVTLGNGTVLRGDVIVGADGIKSVLRTTVLGREEKAKPTGLSAYRMLVPAAKLESLLADNVLPRDLIRMTDPAATTMVVGHDKRVIMGPGRGGNILGIVALVPDEKMHESSSETEGEGEKKNAAWTTAGDMAKLLEAYADFPPWLLAVFKLAPEGEIGLWQLRDTDPLPTWTKGKVILVGDAAHAMLPTQGQGASQAIEDAEALQAFLSGLCGASNEEDIEKALDKVFRARYERATLIQTFSREQAKPGTGAGKVTLNPGEFMQYNCNYHGAEKWLEDQQSRAKV